MEKNSAILVGIDPGLSGALAFYDPTTAKLVVHDMPTKQVKLKSGKVRREIDCLALARIIEGLTMGRDLRACIEKVSAMPGQGVTSMFSFGRAVGVVEGELGYAGVDPVYVTPQTWQKMLVPNGDKAAHRVAAGKVWRAYQHYFQRNKDDGRADAALILKWFMENDNV